MLVDKRAHRWCIDNRGGTFASEWCNDSNFWLNIRQTKEIIVDYRRLQEDVHAPLYIGGVAVERIRSNTSLGVHLTDHLTWSLHT